MIMNVIDIISTTSKRMKNATYNTYFLQRL